MLKTTSIIIIAFIVLLCVVSWWGGIFDSVRFERAVVGPYNLVYREYVGPYAGYRYLLKNVVVYLKEKRNIEATTGFSIFYDDPTSAVSDSIRCSAGVLLDSQITVEPPYKTAVLEKTDAIVGTFPIKSFFSYTTGLYKLHDALKRYCGAADTCKIVKPIIEIYDVKAKEIRYIAPVGQQKSPAPPFSK